MSRIAYCICGLYPAGHIPAFNITNGWFWLFLPASDTLPDYANFPFPFNILDCVRLYWNINAITVEEDITYTPDDGGDPIVTTDSGTFQALDDLGDAFTDEQQLITANGFGILKFQGTSDGGSFGVVLVPSRLNILAEDLYPQFSFSGLPGSMSFVPSPWETGVNVVSNIPSINGQTLFGADSTAPNYTGTLAVNATSFWSYDGVFDASSGAQLIIPVPKGL